jgi:hypothetical protein
MGAQIVTHFGWQARRNTMRTAARARAGHYSADRIMTQYVKDLGLPTSLVVVEQRSVA